MHSSDGNYPYHKHQPLLGIFLGNVSTCVRVIAPKECTVDIYIYILFLHIFLSCFQVLQTLVRGLGFEDVKFSSKICSSGSLQGVLAESHYNRAWFVHELFVKALERLLLTRFLVEEKPYIPVSVRNGDFQSERLDEKLLSHLMLSLPSTRNIEVT